MIDMIINFNSSKLRDNDHTSPLEVLDHLDFYENNLRTALLLAHNYYYQKYNKEEFVSGVEIIALQLVENTIFRAQVGQPHVFHKTKNELKLLYTSPDLSSEFGDQSRIYAPLPTKMLGLNKEVSIDIHKFNVKPEDQIILIHRHKIYPFNFIPQTKDRLTLENMSDYLVQNNEDLPFWLGILDLS